MEEVVAQTPEDDIFLNHIGDGYAPTDVTQMHLIRGWRRTDWKPCHE